MTQGKTANKTDNFCINLAGRIKHKKCANINDKDANKNVRDTVYSKTTNVTGNNKKIIKYFILLKVRK